MRTGWGWCWRKGGVKVQEREGELSVATELLAQLALEGQVVTGDALYAQRQLCEQIEQADGDYLIIVKDNQPRLLEDITFLFEQPPQGEVFGGVYPERSEWAQARDRHGDRQELRRVWTSGALNDYLDWPGLGQVCKIERASECKGKLSIQVRYAISSLSPQVGAATILEYVRGHWSIENRLHYVRDVSLGEDASQVRTGAVPQVLAALRNVVLTLLRSNGAHNIAAALRHNAWQQHDVLSLFSVSTPTKMKRPWCSITECVVAEEEKGP